MNGLRLNTTFFHLDCPKVTTSGGRMPQLRALVGTEGKSAPIFVCPRCQIRIAANPQLSVERSKR